MSETSKSDFKIEEIVWKKHDEIKPYPNNNKQHPEEQIKSLMQMILKFGFDQPVVVDGDMVIIKGHARHEAARRLDIEIPVIVRTDMSEEDVRASRIADNAVARSDWEIDNLKYEVGTLKRLNYDMELTGLSEKELAKLEEDDEAKEEDKNGAGFDVDEKEEYVVSVKCVDEAEMADLYQELKDRGFECSLITS